MRNLLVPFPILLTFLHTNNTKVITKALVNEFGNNTNEAGHISIDNQLKPLLVKRFENLTTFNPSKCNNLEGCPVWYRSYFSLTPTLSLIGNVSKSIGILILNGENDSDTPVQQAFLLQQRLTDVNYPDHTLITYPNLGHIFNPTFLFIDEIVAPNAAIQRHSVEYVINNRIAGGQATVIAYQRILQLTSPSRPIVLSNGELRNV